MAQNSMAKQVNQEAQVALRQQLHSLKTRMEAAIQLNSSLEPQLQLSSEELMLNTTIRYWPLFSCPLYAYRLSCRVFSS